MQISLHRKWTRLENIMSYGIDQEKCPLDSSPLFIHSFIYNCNIEYQTFIVLNIETLIEFELSKQFILIKSIRL